MVDFPDPDDPTNATFLPAGMVKEMSFRIGLVG